MKLHRNIIIKKKCSKKKKPPKNIPSIGLKTHFIKQMVKEDFHSSKYDRLSNVTQEEGGRETGGEEMGRS